MKDPEPSDLYDHDGLIRKAKEVLRRSQELIERTQDLLRGGPPEPPEK
jgi:hypothetical protein